jgi:hypothetical protein
VPRIGDGLSEDDWRLLLTRIESGNCTPFLGAGMGAGMLPLGGDIAEDWAREFAYPLSDSRDLARVSQFVAVRMGDAMAPKERICRQLARIAPPGAADDTEPHAVLASLPLPVFITTNYDGFMAHALEAAHKDPRPEICRWNGSPAVKGQPVALTSGFTPTPAQPIVFHLHGRLEVPESLVLTEDDYLDFLVAVSRNQRLLPHQIKKALAGASLLFIGYRLADWNFRVLHRGLVMAGEQSLRRLSVTVQVTAADAERDYLERYFGAMNVRVYWGKATEFVAELRDRWAAFERHG